MLKYLEKITLLQKEEKKDRVHFKVNVKWSDKNFPEIIELWGIQDNVLVTQEYNNRIEEIIYAFNHDMCGGRESNKYFFPLRYFIKQVPASVEEEIRNWVINGKFNNSERFEMYTVPVDYTAFLFYDKEKNVVIPLSQLDFFFETEEEFENMFTKLMPTKAKISTYYLVTKNALLLQLHINWFVKNYYKRYYLLEDVGIYPEKQKELQKIFKFTCPVCTDNHTPAGLMNFPKPFYNKNKDLFVKMNNNHYTIIISNPDSVLKNYNKVNEILSCAASENNPLEITFHQYEKVANNQDLLKNKYLYSDYVNMANQLGDNYELPWNISSERTLKSLHDNIIKEFNLRKNTSKKEIKDKYLKLKEQYPKYEISNDKFLIKYPEDIDDLSVEGQSLHHCVGSYKNRVINGEAIILFLRTRDNCDSPFVTLHIAKKENHYDLIQAHGVCNCSIKTIDGVYDFVKCWCKQFNIVMENIDRAI